MWDLSPFVAYFWLGMTLALGVKYTQGPPLPLSLHLWHGWFPSHRALRRRHSVQASTGADRVGFTTRAGFGDLSCAASLAVSGVN